MKPKAYCMIRSDPVYRQAAFMQGLSAAGFDAHARSPSQASPGDVLVIWNRYGSWHEIAVQFEKTGGTVLVAENGYCANDRKNRTRYALARAGHNGSGWWFLGGPERWESLGIELAPWRVEGPGHVLVCPNRSFGMPGFVMDPRWPERVVAKLRKCGREIKVRAHPGNDLPKIPLERDLAGAWAMVIWSSSAGVESLIRGVPVFCEAPWWVCKGASRSIDQSLEPLCSDQARLQAMHRLAWAQWHVEEIAKGEPFQHLCHDAPAFADRV